MSKSLKILFFIMFFLCIGILPVHAIDMNLSNTTATNTIDNTITNSLTGNTLLNTNSILNNNSANTPSPSTSTTNGSGSTYVSQISSLPEADLGLNNILNILLIVIGILLILLGIAIIIRLK